MLTEQPNPKSKEIDRLETADILRVMNEEDKTVANVVEKALPAITQAVDAIVERLHKNGRLIYIGAGTSGRLGLLDAVECVPTFSTSPELVQGILAGGEAAFIRSVENIEDISEAGEADLRAVNLTAQDVVVGIAASGRTPYVLGALAYARSIGAYTVGISCNIPAPVLENVDTAIPIPIGSEVIAGSTRLKSGTAQKMVLNMLSTATMIKLGKVYGNLMVDVKITNEKLGKRARNILMHLTAIDENQAEALLQAADGNVKTAVVMQKRSVTVEEARRLLNEAQGHLNKVIG
jgi:N-acetylmuramic acid 6-phosphate etherase